MGAAVEREVQFRVGRDASEGEALGHGILLVIVSAPVTPKRLAASSGFILSAWVFGKPVVGVFHKCLQTS